MKAIERIAGYLSAKNTIGTTIIPTNGVSATKEYAEDQINENRIQPAP